MTLGFLDQHGAKHGHVWSQTGAGGDEDDRLSKRCPVKGEQARRFRSHEQSAAIGAGKEARRQQSAVDKCNVELSVAALHTG
jgi:hypothetical protein